MPVRGVCPRGSHVRPETVPVLSGIDGRIAGDPASKHKENKHETGCTKKLASAQETKEAPCYEEVHSGEEIKGGGSVKIKD